jgi:hypothetical protein
MAKGVHRILEEAGELKRRVCLYSSTTDAMHPNIHYDFQTSTTSSFSQQLRVFHSIANHY